MPSCVLLALACAFVSADQSAVMGRRARASEVVAEARFVAKKIPGMVVLFSAGNDTDRSESRMNLPNATSCLFTWATKLDYLEDRPHPNYSLTPLFLGSVGGFLLLSLWLPLAPLGSLLPSFSVPWRPFWLSLLPSEVPKNRDG